MNGSLVGHRLIADGVEDFVSFWAVPVFVAATVMLWFLDRPGSGYRWRIACLSGVTSAGLGLLLAQVIGHSWARERPFAAHPAETLLLVPPSQDPSFPSDHAVGAFAIAFSVALVAGARPGILFLAGAAVVGVTRVFVGLHYPGDVGGGILVGFAAALIVFLVARGRWSPIVRMLSRFTDPLVAPLWRQYDALRSRHRPRES